MAAADHHPPSPWRDPDWTSAAIQFVGAVAFNVMTVRALALSLGAAWMPDVGSVLFLVSSWIAWHPISRQHRHHVLHSRSALICTSNMLGSVFFGLSAVGAYMLPSGTIKNEAWNTWGTFLGAVGFFVAAMALRPTAAEAREAGTQPRSQSLPGPGSST